METSFFSKMLATIDLNKPIWERYVVQNLCLDVKGKTKSERMDCMISQYDCMIDWYDTFLSSENGKDCVSEFDRIYMDALNVNQLLLLLGQGAFLL